MPQHDDNRFADDDNQFDNYNHHHDKQHNHNFRAMVLHVVQRPDMF